MHRYTINNPPRPLSEIERYLLEHLLSVEFPGSEELKQQSRFVLVSQECQDCSSIVFTIENKESIKEAKVKRRIPVEAESIDSDEMRIHVLVFVRAGYLDEMEIYREDLGKICKFPLPESVNIIIL